MPGAGTLMSEVCVATPMKLRYRLQDGRVYVRIASHVPDESRVWRMLGMMGCPMQVEKDPRALSWSRYVPEAAFGKLQKAAKLMRATLEPEAGEAPLASGAVSQGYRQQRPVDVDALLKLAREDPDHAQAALRAGRTELALFVKNTPAFANDGRRDLRALDAALDSLRDRMRREEKEREQEAGREISAALRGVDAGDVWKASTELAALRQRADDFEQHDALLAPLPERIPGFRGHLRDYQADGVRFLLGRGLNAILADEMGLGKTVMTIAAVLVADERALVVGPANVLYNWADEVERFTDEVPLVYHQQRFIGNLDSRFMLTTYDALRGLHPDDPQLAGRGVLVLDEAHYVRNPKTQRARVVASMPQKKRILLTGTPLVNTLEDYYELLKHVDAKRFTSRTGFRDTWTVDASLFNKYAQVRNLAAGLLQRATRDVLLRRRREDVLSDLPPRTISVTKHEMAPKDERAYRQLESQAADVFNNPKSDVAVFAALHSLRHHLALSRVEAVHERLKELLEAGESVVVYSHYLEPLRKLHEALAPHTAMLDGSTPPKQRQALARSFGTEDGPKVLLAQMEAGGIGLNFTASRWVLFVHLGWTPAVHAQAMDRVHRIGQDRPVTVEFFVTPETIDERMVRILLRKEADQNLVLADSSDFMNRAEVAKLLAQDAKERADKEKAVAFGDAKRR